MQVICSGPQNVPEKHVVDSTMSFNQQSVNQGLTVVASGVLQKLPVTIPELVESSPSLAADGSLVIGSRHTNVYLLDSQTGLLDHMFLDVASLSSDLEGLPGGDPPPPPPGAPAHGRAFPACAPLTGGLSRMVQHCKA